MGKPGQAMGEKAKRSVIPIRGEQGQAYTEYVIILFFSLFMVVIFADDTLFDTIMGWAGDVFFRYYESVSNYLNVPFF